MIPAESTTPALAAWARARLDVLDTTGELAAAVDELERRALAGELNIKRLNLRPDDVVVVELEAPISAAEAAELRDLVEETFAGRHRALVLGDGAQLAVAGDALEIKIEMPAGADLVRDGEEVERG